MDDEIKLNIKLTQKQKQWLWVAFLVLIPIFLAIFFRSFPADLPITQDWAEQSVNGYYQSQLTAQIKSQFPNLPQAQVDERVNGMLADLQKQNPEQINGQIAATAQEFKNRMQNDAGETYLLAIDPWVYYMDAQNVVDNGHAGEELRDGKGYETRNLAPIGSPVEANWHSYVMIATWKFLSLFDSNLSLMGGAFWVPVIIAALSTIPAFFLARRKAGNLGGFIAAAILAVHTAFLGRTPGGFSDTDAYNVFFPLLITWLFLEAFEAKELWKKLTLAASSGIVLGLYSRIWVGYWYILDIIIATVIGYLAFITIRHIYQEITSPKKKKIALKESPAFKSIKATSMLFAVFYAATGLVVTMLYSFSLFLKAPLGFIYFTQLKDAVNPTLWPNVLTTVAELSDVNFSGVLGQMGGTFLFALALFGVVAAILPKKLDAYEYTYIGVASLIILFLVSQTALALSPITYLVILGIPIALGILLLIHTNKDVDIKYAVLMVVWFIVAMYTTTKGVRFTLILVPSFAILIGTLLGIAHRYFSQIIEQELELPKKIVVPILAIIMCLVLIAPIQAANQVALNQVPSMNDGWYNSLTSIRDNSESNAIITSWWDFGHWFKAIAQRAVTFDGATQNTPMAHWVGKLLLSPNEDESIGILRMLDCGSYTGFDELQKEVQDSLRTKKLFNEVVKLEKEDAREYLREEGVSEETITTVLELTHCEPPEGFLITSQDMVGKAGVWGHFGSWTFERAYVYNNLRSLPQDQAVVDLVARGVSEETATRLYQEAKTLTSEQAANSWISPWPAYSGGWVGCQEQNASVNMSAVGVKDASDELETRTILVCPTSLRISTTSQGDVVIESIMIDKKDPAITRFRYGIYSGGVRYQGSDDGRPQVLSWAHQDKEDGVTQINYEGQTSGLGVLYDEENKRVLISDPLHSGSLFTQLFFLDGKYNDRFEKFSDQTTFNGQRIIVWKARW